MDIDLQNKKKQVEDAPVINVVNDEKKEFYVNALFVLNHFIKEFAFDFKEVNSDTFKKNIDHWAGKIISENKILKKKSLFEKQKKIILKFISTQKKCVQDREKEYMDIVDLLSKAFAEFDTNNQVYNQTIYEQSENIEKITLIEDIKAVKTALTKEIKHIRETIKEKQINDENKVKSLSKKIKTLTFELEKAKEESLSDSLTDIYNRKAYDMHIRNLVERNSVIKTPFSMLLIDIDNFKLINDNYGHQLGDRVLFSLAHKLKTLIRNEDFLSRYGGEEFVLIFPGASLRNAKKKAKHLCRTIEATRYSSGEKSEENITITISIGISAFRKGDSVHTVIERADKALYVAKNSGKNQAVSEKDLNKSK